MSFKKQKLPLGHRRGVWIGSGRKMARKREKGVVCPSPFGKGGGVRGQLSSLVPASSRGESRS